MQILSVLYVAATCASSLLTGWLGWYAWSSRAGQSARVFTFAMAVFTYTSFAFFMMSVSADPKIIAFFAKARFLGLTLIPVALLLATLRYTNRERWLRPQIVLLLLIIPLIIQVAVWTGGENGRFFSSWTFAQYGLISVEVAEFTGWFWVHVAYSYALISIVALMLIVNLIHAPGVHRRQAAIVLIGIVLAVALNLSTRLSDVSHPIPNLTPIGLAIGGIVLAIMLFRFNLLTILPIANDRVVESMGDGVIVLDMHKRVVSFNPAAANLIEQSSAMVIGKSFNELFPEQRHLTSRFGQGLESIQEVQIGPARRTFEWKISPIVRRDQHAVGWVIILRDIAQRKLAQQRASELAIEREKVRLLSNFVHDTSHELRTPLSVMRISLYLLKRRLDRDAQAEQLEKLEAQVEQLETIVEQVNDMVNLDTELKATVKPISVNLVRQCVPSMFERLIDQKHLTLIWRLEPDLALVRADETLFISAFQNLLQNAILYTPPGGRVTIRTGSGEKHWVFVEVSDNGIGISVDDLPHIFERFYKANKARTANGSGMGLGLAMVKKIMELHGGTVSVESTLTQGSTFRISFPTQISDVVPNDGPLPMATIAYPRR